MRQRHVVCLILCLVAGQAVNAADMVTDLEFIQRPERASRKVVFPQPTKQPPKIDGRIDDACWRNAAVLRGFVDHTSGAPAEEQTVAWLTYDAGHVYLAVDAEENQLDTIKEKTRKRGNDVWPGDSIEFHLDPKGEVVSSANSMWSARRSVTVPAEGGPYRLLCTRIGYVSPQEDALMAWEAGDMFRP
jgi:hypothetical protein